MTLQNYQIVLKEQNFMKKGGLQMLCVFGIQM